MARFTRSPLDIRLEGALQGAGAYSHAGYTILRSLVRRRKDATAAQAQQRAAFSRCCRLWRHLDPWIKDLSTIPAGLAGLSTYKFWLSQNLPQESTIYASKPVPYGTSSPTVAGLAAAPGASAGEIDLSWSRLAAPTTWIHFVATRKRPPGDPLGHTQWFRQMKDYQVDFVEALTVSGLTPGAQYWLFLTSWNYISGLVASSIRTTGVARA